MSQNQLLSTIWRGVLGGTRTSGVGAARQRLTGLGNAPESSAAAAPGPRKRVPCRHPALLALAITTLLWTDGAIAQCQYDLTEMERISCGFFSVGGSPRGMNEQGVVVGRHLTCGGEIEEAFIWVPGEDVEFLQRPGSNELALANDVNCHEEVVGWLGHTESGLRTAVRWEDGLVHWLPIPPGGNFSEAFAINDAGQIAGTWGNSATGDPALAAFLWQEGKMIDLSPILGTEDSTAEGLNEHGDIVGWMGTGFSDAHAYVISSGVVTDLGVVPGGTTGRAKDINERGDVILNGMVEHEGEVVNRAALWADGEMTDLGVLPGQPTTGALALNNMRQVVGSTQARAILWQHGELYDLNDLLLVPHTSTFNVAIDINESGQILASGGGSTVVLTPAGRPPTDLDINCQTDVHDLLILLDEWHQADSPADFDGDGLVGFADLLLLLDQWG